MSTNSRKRIKLDPSTSPSTHGSVSEPVDDVVRDGAEDRHREEQGNSYVDAVAAGDEVEDEHCVICLHGIRDRTILPCAHDRLCFDCILVWCQQSRKCPLCNASIGDYLIHNFRSNYDYSKYYLPPLRTSPPPPEPLRRLPGSPRNRGRHPEVRWGQRRRLRSSSLERQDELELAISRRRWVYRHHLFAKHVASNPYTRYKPCPTPAQISASPDLLSRATIFIRRELRVWVNLDVEFLTTFIISLMKSLDLRSESSVKLLAEFLDMDTPYYVGDPEDPCRARFPNAEHFAHELYSYLRSPFRDLSAYDSAVQYDIPAHVPPAPEHLPVGRGHSYTNLSPGPGRSSGRPNSSSRNPRPRSPSPGFHSPRDTYSPSASPPQSQDIDPEYAPRVPNGEASNSHRLSSRTDHQERLNGTYNRDEKGKYPEVPRSRPTPWRPRGSEDHSRSKGRSSSTGIRSARRPPLSRANPNTPASPGTSSSKTRLENKECKPLERSGFQLLPSNSSATVRPTPARVNESKDTSGVLLTSDTSREGEYTQGSSDSSDQPTAAPASASMTGLGISIKGQAKLLERGVQEVSASNSAVTWDESVQKYANDIVPRKRPIILTDILQAHITPGKRHSSVRNSASYISANTGPSEEPRARDLDNGHDISSNHPHQMESTPRSHPSQAGLSAPEIMAKTRARLATLRAESSSNQPLIDVVPRNPSTIAPGTGEMGALDMRSRLLERLEEEKRQACEGDQSCAEHVEDTLTDYAITKTHSSETAFGHQQEQWQSSTGITTSSEELEKNLRTKALVRARLAAEKKRSTERDQKRSAKEEALRERLLSRRA